MSTVYKAVREDDPQGEPVAAKIIHRDLCEKPEFVARYRREVNVYRGLNHPNIVALLDWGDYDGLLYIVLEFVQGETLREQLDGALSLETAMEILEPIFAAVGHAHAQGVFHRDLKPENVMIDQHGRVKVMDFGLAKVVDAEKLTQTGTTLGTPAYMPPEQIKADQVGPPADQYALGAMAFEMLTGRLPFPADDPYQMLFAHLSEPVPEARSVNPELSEEIEKTLSRMLAKEPEDRFPSLEEAWSELVESAHR